MFTLPKNIYIISLVMSLSFIITSMMMLIAGLLGASIAPYRELATLPVAMMVVGTAVASIPAAMIMQKIGRKAGMAVGNLIALTGTGLGYLGAVSGNFWLFLVGAFCIGLNAAFIQQGRFIILENANNPTQEADGLTLALMANLIAAIIGPLLGGLGKDLVSSPAGYAGSFLLAAAILVLALVVLSLFKNQPIETEQAEEPSRPLRSIAKQPLYIMAAGSAAVGYGVMSLVMTATPVSMVELSHHSIDHTTLVIQSHIVAMFLPSLLTGYLIKKGLRTSLLATALMLYAVVSVIAFSGAQVLHYWWALLLLGIGWNFLFVTSTSMLPDTYRPGEKFKAQALNDFLVFTSQAIAAFSAGWLLFNWGWINLLRVSLIVTLIWSACLIYLHFHIRARNRYLQSTRI
jgi:MFS family permease